MNKMIGKLSIICMILILSFENFVTVYADENGYENDTIYRTMIENYYEMVNAGKQENILELYTDELALSVSDFFSDINNKVLQRGIFGVNTAIITNVVPVSYGEEYWHNGNIYNNVNTYFVKCKMDVEFPDKYYTQGNNYFIFYIGEDSEKSIKILNIEIPTNNYIMYYDSNEEDCIEYIHNRNIMIYGEDLDAIQSRQQTSEPSIYVDYVKNPSKIRVLVNGNVVTRELKDYCKTVAAGEITVLKNTEALRACALSIKMFAIHHILSAATGTNYDINATDQVFNENNTRTEACNNAVDYTFNYFLLDMYGSMFKTFYRKSSSSTDGQYCKQNGGILSQLEADDLAAVKSWKDILKYYYTRTPDISYYNTAVKSGSLIITTAHVHDWSGGTTCGYCGAIAD